MFRKAIFAAALAGSAILCAPVQASVSVDPGALFGYIPLTAFGTPSIGMTTDGAISFNIPSVFFAGESWTRMTVFENGFITLGNAALPAGLGSMANQSLPTAGVGAPILAPYWADIDATGNGAVRVTVLTDGVSDWIVVDWDDVLVVGQSQLSSFEIWMGTNGSEDVTFAYESIHGGSAFTVGAQASGADGDTYLYNAGAVSSDLRVTTSGLPVTPPVVPEPATWAMMIAGFALAGAAMRHRRSAVRFA